jgi:hypothetical protein
VDLSSPARNRSYSEASVRITWNTPSYKAWRVRIYEKQGRTTVLSGYDGILTPPGTQYGATQGKPQKRNQVTNGEFATLGKPPQHVTDHS